MQTLIEQRKRRRYDLSFPVLVNPKTGGESAAVASSLNISAGGIYFIVSNDFELRSELEFELALPRELTHGEDVRIQCSAKIVRVGLIEGENQVGVAACIDKYKFVRSSCPSLARPQWFWHTRAPVQ